MFFGHIHKKQESVLFERLTSIVTVGFFGHRLAEAHFAIKENSAALPKSFFQQVHKQCQSVFSVLRDANDEVRAFIFSGLSESIINPFAFGRDYREDSGVNAYYVLHIDLIQKYSSSRTQQIDLGITNYFLKQNFGARLQRSDLCLKLNNPVINKLLGPAIARRFSVIQARERNVFKHDHPA